MTAAAFADTLGALFALALLALAAALALVPYRILRELREQGAERRAEAARLFALLAKNAPKNTPDAPAPDPLQTFIDTRPPPG